MSLPAEIYKHPMFASCSNGGISARHNRVTIVNIEGPFEPSPDAPPVILERHMAGCLRLVPAEWTGKRWIAAPGHWMNGGAYVATSDGRFGSACERLLGVTFYGAVALHDRTER